MRGRNVSNAVIPLHSLTPVGQLKAAITQLLLYKMGPLIKYT